MNDFVVNTSPVGASPLAGMKRRQAQDASMMGLGALSFADLMLMLFSPDTLQGMQTEQAQTQAEGNVPLSEIAFPISPGLELYGLQDVGADLAAILEAGAEIASPDSETDFASLLRSDGLPFMQRTTDVSGEIEAALQTLTEQNTRIPAEVTEQSADFTLPDVRTTRPLKPTDLDTAQIATESTREDGDFKLTETLERSKIISLTSRRSESAAEAKPLEDFRTAAGEVKLRMSRDTAQGTDEAMQGMKAAESPAPRQFEIPKAAEKQEAVPENYGIPEQIRTGITQRLTEGKSEFTIKLRPEKLGEITVKLIEESGKMTLRIEAVRSETARLINNDLAALREAVSPMQVEVHEAVVPTHESSQMGFHEFAMGGQQQFSGNQSFHRGQGQAFAYEFETEAGEIPERLILAKEGYDRYV